MLVPAGSLGAVSPEAAAAVAAAGGTVVQKPPSPGWVGPFPEPIQYEAVFPGGLRISADNLSYSIAASDPGSERSIIQQMLTTVAYEQTGSVPEAVTAAQRIVPPTIPMAYTGIYAGMAPAAAPTPTQITPAAAPTQPAAPTPTQITRTYQPRVAVSNLTRGGSSFRVGDEWLLSIGGGAPSAPVTVSGSQNGKAFGPTTQGRTDAAGLFQLGGRMSEAELGHWEERWSVGSDQASPVLSFDVAAAATPSGAGVAVTGGGPGGAWRATGAEVTPEKGERAEAEGARLPAATDILAWLTAIPWYVWAAIAGGVVLLRRSAR